VSNRHAREKTSQRAGNSDMSVAWRRLLRDNEGIPDLNSNAAPINVGLNFTTLVVNSDAQKQTVTNNVFKQTYDTMMTKKDNSEFKPERSSSHDIQRTSSGSKSELLLGRCKSEPLKSEMVPVGISAGAPASSNLPVSRKKVLKGSSLLHLNSSAAPIDNGPKSHTSRGSAFYSKVVARQVSQAAEQAAKRAKSRPTSKPPQKVPQMLFPPSPVAAMCKIIASLLGLLIFGWQICIYRNLWFLTQKE